MKSVRFNRFALLAAMMLLVSSLVITGCKNDDDDDSSYEVRLLTADDKIYGKWQDDYTSWNTYTTYDFNFTADAVESGSYGRQEGSVYICELTKDSGYIYYQIKDTTSFSYSAKDASSYLDKWYGIYYEKLTSDSVCISDACPASVATDYACFDTLEAAVAGLTVDAGYFSYAPECTRVTE